MEAGTAIRCSLHSVSPLTPGGRFQIPGLLFGYQIQGIARTNRHIAVSTTRFRLPAPGATVAEGLAWWRDCY